MGLYPEQLYKMVLFFSEKKVKKHQIFLEHYYMVYKIFLDLATGWGWLYKMVLILFQKQRTNLQNGLELFFLKC